MNLSHTFGRLLGYDDVSRIERWRASFGSAWAHNTPALVFFLCLGAAALAVVFYLRWQKRGHVPTRLSLAAIRAAILSLLVVILADPILELTLVSHPKPVMWLLFDGTDSMSIPDELPTEEGKSLKSAVGWDEYVAGREQPSTDHPARADFVRAWLSQSKQNSLAPLLEKFDVKAFAFDDAEGVRNLLAGSDEREAESESSEKLGKLISAAWKTEGTVTALGEALSDLAARQASDNLAGVMVFSDFDQNAGTAPIGAARKLGAPIFTVGVGPLSAVDLSIDLLAPPTMKAAEASTVSVTVRQREIEPRTVEVRLFARPAGDEQTAKQNLVGVQTLALNAGTASVEFPYTPGEPGALVFTAEVDPVAGEVVVENNRTERDVTIIDDFLRLLYVEYEPTWEWRFVKEVFHRDKLVGMRGFRTFLRSADPTVRETNELFVPGLTLPRSEFFQTDVIFLGDMPATALSNRFCEMTKEFVSQFGGGLVVIAGPRFGPAALASTPLADMLPVVIDPDLPRKDDGDFRLQLTPLSQQFDFMRLGGGQSADHMKAWNNLGKLSWYQPVLRTESRSTTVLAEHPTDLCADGRTKQPLIAVRKYGRGEVVYIGFNEMWRLRRMYGEEYYRQFWGQMIYRLGLSHALGSHKRFVARTDKQTYRAGEMALVTVEAFDKDFQPLAERDLPDGKLWAELIVPERDGTADRVRSLAVPQLRQGVFEARVPVSTAGEYRLKVNDPVNQDHAEINFEVSGLSMERRSAVRNVALQRSLAAETGGKAYDLTTVSSFLKDYDPPRREERTVDVLPLWNTWLSFIVIIGLMLAEWFLRKQVNLA